MVGAVTSLIVIVAVFLAYNANNGLPFVPVYSVSLEVPNAARLTSNNEIRIGGTRVGIVETIEPIVNEEASQSAQAGGDTEVPTVGARLNLKLDESAKPLPEDSVFRIRYRSTFGLKYLEIVRGTGPDAAEGHIFNGLNDTEGGGFETCDVPTNPATFSSTIPDAAKDGCFQTQTEFDAISNTFDNDTRRAGRDNLVGYGNAFAARGMSLNDAIEVLNPLFANLGPVSRVLAARSTRLERFFIELADTARIVAPVSDQQAQFFTNAAIAFEALSRDPEALKETISEGPATLATAIDTLPRQRPFLADFAELSRRLRPGVQDLRVALPVLNRAIDVGTPVLNRTPRLNRDLRRVFQELDRLIRQPETLTTLTRLQTTFPQARRLARYVVPSQTVCNHWNYWFTFLPEALSDRDQVGFNFRQALTSSPRGPSGVNLPVLGDVRVPGETIGPVAGYSGVQATGRFGEEIPPDLVAQGAEPGEFAPLDLPTVHGHPYGPTGQDGSDCQGGQSGYLLGQARIPGQPKSNPSVAVRDLPGDRGPTTLFYNDANQRKFRDTRVPSRQP
jgi:ABC-type transporter Mla subunit MlaD